MATVTDYAHPLKLVALGTLAPSQTPLSYPSPPTPIPVPESPGAAAAAIAHPAPPPAQGEGEAQPPADEDAAATKTCRSIAGSSPTATVPAFCHPSLHVNAPRLAASPRGSDDPDSPPLPTGTVHVGTAADKIACCAECARLFNCVAWRFVPVYVGDPTDRLPGGFDPWGRGSCDVVYHVGTPDPDGGGDDTPDLCPNGRVGDLLEGSTNPPPPPPPPADGGNATHARSWMNVYYNGWNQGSCGAPVNAFEEGTDDGMGDEDTLCPE